jgi:hypothetical protein
MEHGPVMATHPHELRQWRTGSAVPSVTSGHNEGSGWSSRQLLLGCCLETGRTGWPVGSQRIAILRKTESTNLDDGVRADERLQKLLSLYLLVESLLQLITLTLLHLLRHDIDTWPQQTYH